MNEETTDFGTSPGAEPIKATKAKPTKVLPTDRLAFEKQLNVLRGYAAASGTERKAVSNKDVGAIVQIHENTVSICNPFFQDIGLLVKEGLRTRPSDDVADYAQAFEWDSDKAAYRLAPVFRKAWFGTALIPKLTFRSLSKEEATTFLANEAKAPKEYKSNLEVLIEFLKVAGVIQFDGSTVTLGPNARDSNDYGTPQNGKTPTPSSDQNQNGEIPTSFAVQLPRIEPLVRGLVEKLPPPDSAWSLADRAKWLNAAANIFDLMYKEPDNSDAGIGIILEGKTLSIKKG